VKEEKKKDEVKKFKSKLEVEEDQEQEKEPQPKKTVKEKKPDDIAEHKYKKRELAKELVNIRNQEKELFTKSRPTQDEREEVEKNDQEE